MYRQLKSKFTIATLTAMVSLVLSTQAQAATVGATNIISNQHEPLSASIDLSNIDADNFSANIAGKAVYEQMDMSTDVPVRVQFVKTSPSTGKLILTSAQPVSEPYADVVLVLNEGGKQQSLPKTLLLPAGNNAPPRTPTNPVVTPRVANNTNVAPINVIEPTNINKQYVMVGDSINPSLPSVQARDTYQFPQSTKASNTRPNASASNNNNSNANPNRQSGAQNRAQGVQDTAATSANNVSAQNSKVTITRSIRPVGANNTQAHDTFASQINTNTQAPIAKAPPMVNATPSTASNPVSANSPSTTAPTARQNTAHNNRANNNQAAKPNSIPILTGSEDLQADILHTEISRTLKMPSGELKVIPIEPENIQAKQSTPSTQQTGMTKASNTNSGATSPDNFKPLIPAPAFKPSPTGQSNMIEEALVKHARENPTATVVNVNTPQSVPKPDTSEASEATLQAKAQSDATTQSDTQTNNNAPDIGVSKITYTVQRNDNLWTISNQIARRNRVDVDTVMTQIQRHNPDAFINGDARLLKANARLKLPDYDVIPSRLGIRAATNAQRTSNRATSRPRTVRAPASRSSSTATARALPRANVTLVTPGSSGSATGSGRGGLSNTLASQVQTTRQQTANEARRVVGLNSQLTEYTRKLQLQNERLGDLERRLKELRQQ